VVGGGREWSGAVGGGPRWRGRATPSGGHTVVAAGIVVVFFPGSSGSRPVFGVPFSVQKNRAQSVKAHCGPSLFAPRFFGPETAPLFWTTVRGGRSVPRGRRARASARSCGSVGAWSPAGRPPPARPPPGPPASGSPASPARVLRGRSGGNRMQAQPETPREAASSARHKPCVSSILCASNNTSIHFSTATGWMQDSRKRSGGLRHRGYTCHASLIRWICLTSSIQITSATGCRHSLKRFGGLHGATHAMRVCDTADTTDALAFPTTHATRCIAGNASRGYIIGATWHARF